MYVLQYYRGVLLPLQAIMQNYIRRQKLRLYICFIIFFWRLVGFTLSGQF